MASKRAVGCCSHQVMAKAASGTNQLPASGRSSCADQALVGINKIVVVISQNFGLAFPAPVI
jgi:hypothetical protein